MNWGGWFKYPLVPPVLNVYKQKPRYWAGQGFNLIIVALLVTSQDLVYSSNQLLGHQHIILLHFHLGLICIYFD